MIKLGVNLPLSNNAICKREIIVNSAYSENVMCAIDSIGKCDGLLLIFLNKK